LRILITGATGFAGSHLSEFLAGNTDAEIYGLDLANETNLPIKLVSCDLMDKQAVFACISEVRPDYIFHLAAIASVADAWKNPEKVLTNNVICQLNILQALAEHNLKPRVLVISTGEAYGAVDKDDLPIDEQTKLKPNNPYSVSKVTQEFLGRQYFESYNIPVIIARAFNHSGPRQRGDFVVPAFTSQLVEIEQGRREPVMYVGNLEAERDFLDVRDVVRAYWLLLKEGKGGEVYNVCSGKTVKIQKVLDILLANSSKEIEVKQDKARMRPSDTPVVVGNNAKLREATGWQPEINFEQTLIDTLEYLRVASSSLRVQNI